MRGTLNVFEVVVRSRGPEYEAKSEAEDTSGFMMALAVDRGMKDGNGDRS